MKHVIIDGVEYVPKEQLKNLLADAKVGDLCKHRNGGWSQIIDTSGTYIPGQPIRTTLKDTNGINRNFCLSGCHFTMQFGGEYDIISTEPLALKGSAEWAWQMWCLLGKMVVFKGYKASAKDSWGVCPQTSLFRGNDVNYWREHKGEWMRAASAYQWQLYAEPKHESQYKVGDWVEYRLHANTAVSGDNMMGQIIYIGRIGDTSIEVLPVGNYEHNSSLSTYHVIYASRIIRKLKPSQVVVKIGCLSGTVRKSSTGGDYFRLLGVDGEASIDFVMLDPETRSLVESLLKAQEEGGTDA